MNAIGLHNQFNSLPSLYNIFLLTEFKYIFLWSRLPLNRSTIPSVEKHLNICVYIAYSQASIFLILCFQNILVGFGYRLFEMTVKLIVNSRTVDLNLLLAVL